MRHVILACACLLAYPALGTTPAQHQHQHHHQEPQGAPGSLAADLGKIDFPNSGSEAAQEPFLRGVLLLHSFEFELARRAFLDAQRADPAFALAYWGEALSHNAPVWNEQNLAAARAALAKLAPTRPARLAKAPTPRERDFMDSVEELYGEGDKAQRDAAYSAALERMASKYPDDLEARSLYALSLIGLTGTRRNPGNYMRAAAEAEEIYEIEKRHPGALHYLIHAYDDPVHAPLGLRAARLYSQVAPAAAHARHMPSHIYFALGMWDEAVASNVSAIEAAREHGMGGYHETLWLVYAYLQQDRRKEAGELLDLLAGDVAKNPRPDNRTHLAAVRATWLVETRGAGAPDLRGPVDSRGINSIRFFANLYFARGLTAASAGDTDAARAILAELHARIEGGKRAMQDITASRYDNVTAGQIRQSELMAKALDGAIRFANGDRRGGIAAVREALEAGAQLEYQGGPPWSAKPLGELLGELLLKDGDKVAAAAAFEAALRENPNRRLTLEGLERARTAASDTTVSHARKAAAH